MRLLVIAYNRLRALQRLESTNCHWYSSLISPRPTRTLYPPNRAIFESRAGAGPHHLLARVKSYRRRNNTQKHIMGTTDFPEAVAVPHTPFGTIQTFE